MRRKLFVPTLLLANTLLLSGVIWHGQKAAAGGGNGNANGVAHRVETLEAGQTLLDARVFDLEDVVGTYTVTTPIASRLNTLDTGLLDLVFDFSVADARIADVNIVVTNVLSDTVSLSDQVSRLGASLDDFVIVTYTNEIAELADTVAELQAKIEACSCNGNDVIVE